MALTTIPQSGYGPSAMQFDASDKLLSSTIETGEGSVRYWATCAPGVRTRTLLVCGLGLPWYLLAPLASTLREDSIILELPGTARIAAPRSGYCMATVRAMLAQACRGLGIEPSCVIGHSLGAVVAAEIVQENSWTLHDLVVLCPPGETLLGLLQQRNVPRDTEAMFAAIGILGMALSTYTSKRLLGLALSVGRPVNPVLRYCFASPNRLAPRDLRRLASTFEPAPVSTTFRQAKHTDVSAALDAIQARRRIALFGQQDLLVPRSNAEAFATQHKGWQTLVVAPAGHWLPFEHPEIVNDSLSLTSE